MPITVPGSPFAVNQTGGHTVQMGLHAAPEVQNSAANGIAQVQESFTKAEQAFQDEFDRTRVMDLTNKLEQSRIDLRDNPETGYRALQGDNALTRPNGRSLQEEVQSNFRASFDEIRKQAGNARQRAALEDVYRRMSIQVDRDVATHVAHEFEVKRAAVESTTIKMIYANASSADPETAEDGMRTLRIAAAAIAKRKGVPLDLQKTMSPVHMVHLSRIADEEMDTQKARAYLEANRAEIDPDDLIKAEKVVRSLENDDKAEAEASRIVSESDSYGAALMAAESLPRDIRSKARANIAKYYAAKERVDRERLRSLKIEAERYAADGNAIPATIRVELDELDPGWLSRLDARIERASDGAAKGEALKFDNKDAYEEIMRLRENDPQAFADLNLRTYTGLFRTDTIRSLERAQREIGRTEREDFVNAVKNQGRIEGIKSSETYKLDAAAQKKWDEWVDRHDGKVPNADEQKRMLLTLFSGRDSGVFWDSDQPEWKAIYDNRDKSVGDLEDHYQVVDADELVRYARRYGIQFDPNNGKQVRAVSNLYAGRGFPAALWKQATAEALRKKAAAGLPGAATNSEIEAEAKYLLENMK